MADSKILTHIDEQGKAAMVDVSHKPKVKRTAEASGKIYLQPATVELIKQNQIAKGDVLAVARIAAISGAKKTSELIPLCHNIMIDLIQVDLQLVDDGVEILSKAICTDKTGIEMEALTAVNIAALAVYDMCKAVDKEMLIGEIKLLKKTKEVL